MVTGFVVEQKVGVVMFSVFMIRNNIYLYFFGKDISWNCFEQMSKNKCIKNKESRKRSFRGLYLFSFEPETEYDFIRIIAENNNNTSFQDVFKHLMFKKKSYCCVQ